MAHQPLRIGIVTLAVLPAVLAAASPPAGAVQAERTAADDARVRAVVDFADHALEKGRDRWSGKDTPLFVDGLEVETGEPVPWLRSGRRYAISNLAGQQNFFRALAALSNLTGDERYRQAARDATAYMFEHFHSPCGLLYWGGHTFVDLRTLEVVPYDGHGRARDYNLSYAPDAHFQMQP